jgi:EAL and modified HD-GYP domain-containing signal transduction protein
MNVFVARQPIFNRGGNTAGYELLYRDGAKNCFPEGVDANAATSRLILNTHLNLGLNTFTQGKTALINFGEESILQGLPKMLPPKSVIIEVLEDVTPSDEVYNALRELFHMGYQIALDDFVFSRDWIRFLNISKIVKIDIQKTPLHTITKLVSAIKQRPNIRLLAEKVETEEELNLAKKMGFRFFQGYFFGKPHMKEAKDINSQQHILLAIYKEAMSENFNVKNIERLFSQDTGVVFKLLRYINSGNFKNVTPITSVRSAINYLGINNMKRFISLLVTGSINSSKPAALIEQSMVRAKFCEKVADEIDVPRDPAFFVGLLSKLDAILDQPMARILAELNVATEIEDALIGEEKSISEDSLMLRRTLDAVVTHESGMWRATQKACAKIRFDDKKMPELYKGSVQWVDEFMNYNYHNETAKPELMNIA